MSRASAFYVLEDKEAVPTESLIAWAQMLEDSERIVAQVMIGEYFVSTVFLGTPHGFSKSGNPLLFETMVFHDRKALDDFTDRYSTWVSAEAGHQDAIRKVREGRLQ